MWHGFQPVPNIKWDDSPAFKCKIKYSFLSHSLWFKSRWIWFKIWIEMVMRTNFHGQDTRKLCVSECELDWQNGPENKTVWRKENNPVVVSLKGAVPSDKETLEAAVSPICAMSRMHSYFLSELRDNVKKPLWHLTFLLVSLFVAKQCDSLGFFLKVESCEKKIQALGSDIERWHSHPCDCLEKGWGYVYYTVFCLIIHTRKFPYDCSSVSFTLGQTYRRILVSWFLSWCICFTVLWSKLSACPLLSKLCEWQMKHCGRWQISIKEAYIDSLPTKAFWVTYSPLIHIKYLIYLSRS